MDVFGSVGSVAGGGLQDVPAQTAAGQLRSVGYLCATQRGVLKHNVKYPPRLLASHCALTHADQCARKFYRLYTIEGLAMLMLRFIHYRWARWHYYLLDWCYLVRLGIA